MNASHPRQDAARLTGDMLIGASQVRGSHGRQRALNPTTDTEIDEPVFYLGGQADVEAAATLAWSAFDAYRALSLSRRARFLEAIAENMLSIGDSLIDRAHAETGLPVARLVSERARTVGQLRLFADVVRDGRFLSVRVDPALPLRQPSPRPDLRLAKMPLGPVAVFGASNFPLAFSVAGGDTAAALAAGAPVIVKAHGAHWGTSELVGRAVQRAVQDLALPEGVFSLLVGAGREIGEALVAHKHIKAVGFTGSRQGGLALMAIANARPDPIPVYAEMSSINPVFLLPAALRSRAEDLGKAFAESLTVGAGQFCTNPGLVVGVEGPELERFIESTGRVMAHKSAQTMLTPDIHRAFLAGTARLEALEGVEKLVVGQSVGGRANAAQAVLFSTDVQRFLETPALQTEVFGPASLLLRARSTADMFRMAEYVEGQLTTSLQLDADDLPLARELLPILERKSGRILVNGFPTGVEVCHAMVHGGPFPATSNAAFTSVGATSIDRFLRPVCYQDFPDELLPAALRAGNPLGIQRLIDGTPDLQPSHCSHDDTTE